MEAAMTLEPVTSCCTFVSQITKLNTVISTNAMDPLFPLLVRQDSMEGFIIIVISWIYSANGCWIFSVFYGSKPFLQCFAHNFWFSSAPLTSRPRTRVMTLTIYTQAFTNRKWNYKKMVPPTFCHKIGNKNPDRWYRNVSMDWNTELINNIKQKKIQGWLSL